MNDYTLKMKERLSYALTNTGQCMIYAIITNYLLLYFTDYLYIAPAVAGIITAVARIFDAANDPLMGAIVDRTKTKWGKCRPYMLFTPIPVAIIALLLFAPFPFKYDTFIVDDKTVLIARAGAVIYAAIVYILFTMVYTTNDIPYWSMSSVISPDSKERVKVVTLTRIIGGLGSAICVGLFWTVNGIFVKSGADKRWGFFLATLVFCILGVALMLQGFFNTKERTKKPLDKVKFFDNLKLIPKCKPMVLNLIAGVFMSVTFVGTTALTTYFVKWNIKEVFSGINSVDIMSIFTPIIGILPAGASLAGLIATPFLIKRYEKRNLILFVSAIGIVANIISFFLGYKNIYIFILGRFISFLPMGVISSITTLMIGDSVDHIQYHTGRRIEGTCFSLLTFMGKFQNGICVAITGIILSVVGYNGTFDPDVEQQSASALNAIFIMVTIMFGLGLFLSAIPFIFYDFSDKQHKEILEELRAREEAEAANGLAQTAIANG